MAFYNHNVSVGSPISIALAASAPAFLELFSGVKYQLLRAAADKQLRTSIPIDMSLGKCFDVCNPRLRSLIIEWIRDGRVWYVHLGTPCTLYSIARKSRPDRASYRVSMCCVDFTVLIIKTCLECGVYFSLENPKTSKLFKVPRVADILKRSNAIRDLIIQVTQRPQCLDNRKLQMCSVRQTVQSC